MSHAMPAASSNPVEMEMGQRGPPPPSYEKSMRQGPPVVQPATAPYPHQNMGMGPGVALHPAQQFHAVPPSSTTVIVTGVAPVGPDPAHLRCPNCNMNITTNTVSENRPSAHIACLLLFFFGCFLCSCIPYCMDSFKSVTHSCPSCKAHIGTWKP